MNMETKILAVVVIAYLLSGTFALGYAAANTIDIDDKTPNQVLVLIKENNLGDDEIENMLIKSSPVDVTIDKLHDYELFTGTVHGKRLFTLNFGKASPERVSEVISKNPLVLIAEPNYIGYVNMIPNDPRFQYQWGLHKIEAPEAWDIETGDDDIVISVIDTGVDLDHEDLADKLHPGWDAVDYDNIPEDVHGHGTRMAGVAGATTNNSRGIAGTCHECMILPVRACGSDGGCSVGNVFKSLEYSVGNPAHVEGIPKNPNTADVISMSFSFASPNEFLLQGVRDAYDEGAVLVAAAGNQGSYEERYPAAYEEVIAVGATNQNDQRASFSNFGDWVDVAAPGVNIITTNWHNSYSSTEGTSPATAFVSGTVGLILSRTNMGINQEQIRQILIDTSDPAYGFPGMPGGRINAFQAVLETPVLFPTIAWA